MIQGTCIRAYATLCGRLIAEDSKPVTNHPAPPTAQRAPAVRTLPSMGVFVVPCTLFIGPSPQMPRSPGGLANCLEDHPKSQSCQWLGASSLYSLRIREEFFSENRSTEGSNLPHTYSAW